MTIPDGIQSQLPDAVKDALEELQKGLLTIYGPRLRGIYLYGSYARGDYKTDSDVDLILALDGMVNSCEEINRLSEIISDICLRYDVLLTIYPIPVIWLQMRKSPLFENIRREGIQL